MDIKPKKILKLIGILILILAIIVWITLFIKLYLLKTKEQIVISKPNYRIAATGLLRFNYFSPLLLSRGGNVVWYSIVPSTNEFHQCEKKEYTEISFLPLSSGLRNASIVGVDIVDGMKCDSKTKMCYYKNVRVIANDIPCIGTTTYSSCVINKPQVFFGRYSDVKLNYVVYCCKTKKCQSSNEKLIQLKSGVVRVKENQKK